MVIKNIKFFLERRQSNLFWNIILIFYTAVEVVLHSRLKLFATSLSYTTLLAIVPLLAVLFALFRSFGIDDVIQKVIHNFLLPLGDSGIEVSNYLFEFIQNTQAGLLGGVGLVFLFYSIFTLIQKVELVLNQIWNVQYSRSIITKVIGYFSSLMLVVIAAIVIVWINLMLKQFESKDILINTPILSNMFVLLIKLISFAIIIILLAILYWGVPNTNVDFKSAIIGGFFCALCWIPITKFFSQVIGASSNYSIIYTSFSSMVILLIWLNIAWLLFLSGALVSYFVQYPNLFRKTNIVQLNPAEKVYYSQKITHILIDHFRSNKGKVSLNKLLAETKLPHKQMLELLKPFLSKQIFIEINERKIFYLLITDPSILTDEYIQQFVYGDVRLVID